MPVPPHRHSVSQTPGSSCQLPSSRQECKTLACSQQNTAILHGVNVVCIHCLPGEPTRWQVSSGCRAGCGCDLPQPQLRSALVLLDVLPLDSEDRGVRKRQLQQSGLDPAHQDDRISLWPRSISPIVSTTTWKKVTDGWRSVFFPKEQVIGQDKLVLSGRV